jgi:hypothetical protein
MAKKFAALVKKLSPAAQARIAAHRERLAVRLPLRELRARVGMTQVAVAESMDTSQGEISKIEQRGDWLVSTLTEYVEALGGELELVARLPDGSTVTIAPVAKTRDATDREHAHA